jgi:hypothetical protein
MAKEIIHNLNPVKPGFYGRLPSTKFVLFLQLLFRELWRYRSKKETVIDSLENMQENFLMFFV